MAMVPNAGGRYGLWIAATVTLGAVLSDCTVGPNFKRPDPPAATRYAATEEMPASKVDAAAGAPSQTVALGERLTADWWTLFHSADLDALVKQAIAGNRSLASAQARAKQAREAIAAASAALYPQASLNASATREKVSTTEFGIDPGIIPLPPNTNVYQFGASLNYTVDVFGGVHRQIEQNVALAEYRRHETDAAYLMLTGDVVAQAVQIAAIRTQLKAIDDILGIDHQNLDLVEKQRRFGAVPDSDVVKAETQFAADQTLRPPLEQQLSVARHALAVLIGQFPGDWSPPDFELAALTLPRELPISLPSELVHDRPDILAAEDQLHAASAQIGIATARLYPAITLSAAAAGTALRPSQLFDETGFVWSVAAGLTQPIFDGGMRKAERRAALAAFKASAADYQQTVLQAFGQVADSLAAVTHDTDLLVAQRRALELASESMRLQRINYERGGIGLLDLLDAQRAYQQARLGDARAEAQRFQDTIRLFLAIGGGFRDIDPGDVRRVANSAGG